MSVLEPQQYYDSVEKALETQKFSPIYFIHGDEPYLIQQALQYLKVCALHGVPQDFNLTQFYASDADISRVRDEVETLPMMASRRVVILKEVQGLTDRDWDQLTPVIEAPVESTVFILVGSKIDKRKKHFKILQDQSVSIEFRKPFENQIPGWIRHICKAHGLSITDEAIQLLHRLAGSQLTEIESEVIKLHSYLGDRKNVELEDVAQCVSKKREENVFDLTESIARGDRVEALVQLAELLSQGQSEVGIVSLVARHIRILLLIKQGLEMGFSNQKLAQYAQVPPYFLNDYLSQARSWSVKKLEASLLVLSETDRALKSSPLSSHLWLENLIFRTCSLHQAAVPAQSLASGPY